MKNGVNDMYRIMIIDDEKSLRCLLKKVIKWDEFGMEVVGEAESGIEAIHKIDDLAPHVVFVDIRMPFMDGIEFSTIAKERYPHLKIVILTAYEEFEYAKKCISIGVEDYLLKPVNRKEVTEVLGRLLMKLKEEVKEQEEIEEVVTGNMGKVKAYLEEAYADSSMNLTSVAQKFGFHPSYLSRRFKEEIGKSFIDYLTSYRMEIACQLAKQKEMMYVVADRIGIKDPNYFGKCFKKYKGVSYSEYMKRMDCEGKENEK